MTVRGAGSEATEGFAISTGAMLGGGRDVRAVYVSYDNGDTWELSYSRSPSLEAAQGKMVTARWAQACFFNDASGSNPADMTDEDADANALHFRNQLAAYISSGVMCFSVGMEGGNALDTTSDPAIDQSGFAYTNNNGSPSAFTSDGTALKAAHQARYEALIEAAGALGGAIGLNLFYGRQGGYLSSQANYENAIETVSAWLIEKGYRNITIDIANESGADASGTWPTSHLFKTDEGSAAMVEHFIAQWDGQPWRPPVGCSSRSKPGPLVLAASDIHWFHGNVAGTPAPGNRDDWCQDILDDTTEGPVVCNEDETQAEENGGATSTKLANELICFDAMNDIAGVSGGTMIAKPWQRIDTSTATIFRPEPGLSDDPDSGTYWERWANFTRAWLDHVKAETGGLPA